MSTFWQQYLAGGNVKAEELTNRLWQGITDPTIRKKVWEAAADKSIHQQKVDLSLLSEDMRNDIELELVPGHFAHFNPPLDENDRTNVLYLLSVDAVMHERKHYIQGYAQLVARMLTVLDNDVKLCMGVLHRLSGKLKEYHQQGPDFPILRTDVLVLADILSRELPEAVNHFNANQFDVVDLSDVVVVWCLALFASQFPAEVVIRMIDIVLHEGCHSLIALVYGIIKVSAKGLMTKTGDALFQSVTDIPVNMNKLQIADSFAIGYKTFRMNEKIINELRKQKQWFKTLELAVGPVIFQKDVGNPNSIKPLADTAKRPHAPVSSSTATAPLTPVSLGGPHSSNTMPASVTFNLDALSAIPETESGSSTPPLTISIAPSHPNNFELLNQLTRAKLEQDLPTLHRLLDSAINEITRQNQYIHTLQTMDYHANRTSMSSNSVSGSPSQRAINDKLLVGEDTNSLRAVSTRERGMAADEDPLTRAKLLAASPLLVHSSERRSSIKKPAPMNGVVKFSELTDYQIFPCLYMEGYLMKSRAPSKLFKRRASSGFFGNLHRRFFVLQGSFVTYFKSHSFKKPSRDESIDMRACKVVSLKNHEFGPFAFQINWNLHKQTSCLYLLFANNETVRDVWVEVLNRAANSPN